MWKDLPPSGTGPFGGGQGGWSQANSPTPCALVFLLWRGRGKGGGGRSKRKGQSPLLTGRGGGPLRLPTGERVILMRDARPLPLWMQRWVARTRVISTLLFMYLQVHEYGSFHFCTRQLEMRLNVDSTLNPRRSYTKATKGVSVCARLNKR